MKFLVFVSMVTSALFTVEGRATSNNVGIGTTTPNVLLSVVDPTAYGTPNWTSFVKVTGAINNFPGFQIIGFGGTTSGERTEFAGLRQRGTIAAPTATVSGDQYASFIGRGYNSSLSGYSGGQIRFVQSGAPTASGNPTDIAFLPNDGTSAVGTETARITSAGSVGIGTAAPTSKLDVESGGTATGNITQDGFSVPIHIAYVLQSANVTVNGGTWTTLTGATTTFTLKRTMTVHMRLMGSLTGNPGTPGFGYCGFRFLIDGVGSGDASWGSLITGSTGVWMGYTVEFESSLAAGAHTITAQLTGYPGQPTSGCNTYGSATQYAAGRMSVDAY